MSELPGLAPSPGLSRLFAVLHGAPLPSADREPDPAAGLAAAYAEGLREGQRQAEGGLRPVRERLAAAAAALDAAAVINADMLRPMFVDLVHRLCAAVLLAELKLSNAALEPLVDAALAAAGPRAARLRLHPDAIGDIVPPPGVAIEADAGMAIDAVAVDGPAFALETSLADRLAELVAAL